MEDTERSNNILGLSALSKMTYEEIASYPWWGIRCPFCNHPQITHSRIRKTKCSNGNCERWIQVIFKKKPSTYRVKKLFKTLDEGRDWYALENADWIMQGKDQVIIQSADKIKVAPKAKAKPMSKPQNLKQSVNDKKDGIIQED